ncbi:MAG: aspartate carbamoyltransferase [Roseiflexaceae bacterium]|nr:aspartate carbamoyltransferase [Roseiflexaceae bacterium]
MVLTLVVTFALLLATGAIALPARQTEVAARGAQVMPFDLEKTQHVFADTEDGGIQQVVALDPNDAAQIALIRQHLLEEAEKFRRGDFADPASIHGSSMPGLTDLRTSVGKIDIVYSELPNGAQLQYTTIDTTLVMALHHWFQAQVSDHGAHAIEQ